jgi:heterotetrameric sarcosine oxidase alpha subunit
VRASHRLPSGGLIDRSKPLSFTFDGTPYQGFTGDTLASALIANGVKLVGRSFKYHRPRGILTAGSEEPNALVELRTGARREPNTRATTTELFDGLEATSQNRWPSLAYDVAGINDWLSPFIVAGFYYKTFMWPAKFWELLYEPLIRRAAGLGRAAGAEDPDHYEKAFAHCDVLVIGAGPTGLAAALAAARAGARVILADEGPRLGGRLLSEHYEIDGAPAAEWVARVEAELVAMPEVRIMRRTTVTSVFDHGQYAAVERVSDHLAGPPAHQPRQRGWKIVAKSAVLAAGALERTIAFGNNDRPGVMLASAVRTYINRYAATPGRKLAIFTNNDDGWRTAVDAHKAGIEIAAVIDSRDARPEKHSNLDVNVMTGARVTHVHGKRAVGAIEVRGADGRTTRIACDTLAVSGGWNPAVHLTCHLGGKPVWNEQLAAFTPGALPPGLHVAGAANGALTLGRSLSVGTSVGAIAAVEAGFPVLAAILPRADDEPAAIRPLWHVKDSRAKAFVDFQNDVTVKDIKLADQEGFSAVEHLKRYTTLGMATDQGKIANVAGLAILAGISGRKIPEVGTTTFRPPYVPVSFGAMSGHHRGRDFRPIRLPPGHDWAGEQRAVFIESGAWMRAQYYPRAGERDWLEAVNREVKTTRQAVGVCDVSTFGKIEIEGADAAAFLDRVCANTLSTLSVGKARYALMLREDGFVQDDGTVARLAPEHFILMSTTANAVRMMQHLEFCRQVLWPGLDVQLTSVSEQWAQFAVAGPRSRDVLRKVVDDKHDISDPAFPHLSAKEVTVAGGVTARLFRLSFSGERAFELAVPARYGDATVRAIMAAGKEFGITPYGIEALNVMRVEKGHVSGPEMNGQLTARDLGLGRMVSKKKDCVGRLMADRPALVASDRPALVGFRPVDRSAQLRAGAHFLAVGAAASIENDQGYMTSVAFSPMLEHWIGLGVLARGPERIGQRVRAYDPVRGGDVEVEICSPHFFDPEGARQHG